jgi:hypothetical protein
LIQRGRRDRWQVVAGLSVLGLASIGLFLVSRGKWSDAIIDSGREWIVPDALARGGLLYRDVVYWFGPFTPYFHAAFFALFGSGFRTLVLAGVVGSIGVLAALHFALRTVTGRREAFLWTALAIPALVFMPNAGGSILGMGYRIWHAAAFALAGIALAGKPIAGRRPTLRAAAVGAFCALSALCRTEWGVVALAASAFVLAMGEADPRRRGRDVAASAGAFLAVFGGTIGAFIASAGWKAVVEDGHVLLTGLPPETREFLVAFSGVRDWRSGILELLYSASMWVGAFLLLHLLATRRSDPGRVRRLLPVLAGVLLLLGLSAALGGAGGAVTFSAAPLVCVAATLLALSRRAAPAPALLGIGLAGALLSYRRPFHIGDSAYVGPQLLFALVCAAGLVQWMVEREKNSDTRERFRTLAAGSVLALAAFGFVGRALWYRGDGRIPIAGTEGMLSAVPSVAARYEELAQSIVRKTRDHDGLAVFPEGELLNSITRRENPMRYKLTIPGYLTAANEGAVLSDLRRSRPAAIVICRRYTSEYGPGEFGIDYGRSLHEWVTDNYSETPAGRHATCRLLLDRRPETPRPAD